MKQIFPVLLLVIVVLVLVVILKIWRDDSRQSSILPLENNNNMETNNIKNNVQSNNVNQPNDKLAGKWQVTEIASDEPLGEFYITLEFTDDAIIANAGEVLLRSTYKITDEKEISMAPIEMDNVTHGPILDQAGNDFLRALQRTSNYEINEAGELVLSSFGDFVIRATRSLSPE